MASGLFFGGVANGFQRQSAISNAAQYQQGLLQLEQQRLQQQQNQQIQAQIDEAKTALFKHIDDDKTAPRGNNSQYDPKSGYMSISRNVDGIADLIAKTQGQEMADIFRAQVAAAVNGPSPAAVEGAMARAKEGPLGSALKQSEINKNNAIARSYPDLGDGAGENPDAPGYGANGQALGAGQGDRLANFRSAARDLNLNAQERSLYTRHLKNLYGTGGVDNSDGSRSSLYQVTAEIDGKTYVIPTVYDGKILKPDDAVKRAKQEGLSNFPSYKSEAEAESRYQQMHSYMEKDTQTFLAGRNQNGGGSKYISSPFDARQKAIIRQAGAQPDQFDFDAVQYAYGNTNVAQGYRSYHGVNPVTVLRSRAAQYWIDKGVSPQDANAVMVEFAAMKHGANTAASIDARMTSALSKAENTAAILTEPGKNGRSLIDSVDRTQYKDLNDFLVNWRGRTGNQPEIRLAIALETLASNYGVSLGMGNSVLTDTQTKRAQDMLQKGWSTGQLGAAVDQIKQEMIREESGTRQGMRRFIGGMQEDMGGGKSETNDNAGWQEVPGMPGIKRRVISP